MLAIRRKKGEAIVIGDNIVITVVDIGQGNVKLAIEAPQEIKILRSELVEAATVNREAAGSARGAELLKNILKSSKDAINK